MHPEHGGHIFVYPLLTLVQEQKVSQPLLLIPEILFQEPDHFLEIVSFDQVLDIDNPLESFIFFDGQVLLRFIDDLFGHAASSINHASQFFLNEHPLHFQLDVESFGMNIPFEMAWDTSMIFLLARISSTSPRVV